MTVQRAPADLDSLYDEGNGDMVKRIGSEHFMTHACVCKCEHPQRTACKFLEHPQRTSCKQLKTCPHMQTPEAEPIILVQSIEQER